MTTEHVPVLASKIDEIVNLTPDAVIVDCTTGYGGHSQILGEKLGQDGCLIGLDVDNNCLERARQNLRGLKCRVLLKQNNFSKLAEVVHSAGYEKIDFILADLGWCSGQITDPQKGLSFQENQSLDMRLDPKIQTTAAEIVNTYTESQLADLIYQLGEERASRRIARFIVETRKNQPIKSTAQLSLIVCRAIGKAPGVKGIHPATKTFQALRIAVNNELENLDKLLEQADRLLKPGGMIAVISFHSLEDRIVKLDFQQKAKQGIYNLISKKPIVPDNSEVRNNPRSRSAKMRIAQRQV